MKCLLLALLIGLSLQTFSQESATTVYNKDYYLKKSKTQKTIGWVSLGVGSTLIVVGAISSIHGAVDLVDGNPGKLFASSAFLVTGVALDAVSIPFFISGSKNKKRADAIVAFRMQPMFLPKNNFALSQEPTLSVKIGF